MLEKLCAVINSNRSRWRVESPLNAYKHNFPLGLSTRIAQENVKSLKRAHTRIRTHTHAEPDEPIQRKKFMEIIIETNKVK